MPTTTLFLFALILLVAVLLAAAARHLAKNKAQGGGAYQVRRALLSPAERSFVGVLDGALPDGLTWMTKVRLADVFMTRKGLQPAARTRAWNRISQKHVDFLLVRTSDFAPVAGIELDDGSHDADDRKTRDAFVDEVFRACGVPLLHVPAQQAYHPNELRAKVSSLVESKPTADLTKG